MHLTDNKVRAFQSFQVIRPHRQAT